MPYAFRSKSEHTMMWLFHTYHHSESEETGKKERRDRKMVRGWNLLFENTFMNILGGEEMYQLFFHFTTHNVPKLALNHAIDST